MALSKHEEKKPMELWNMKDRAAYQLFPLDIFRNHIYQEQRTAKYLQQFKSENKYGDKWKDFRDTGN